ncbi:EF-hand calcium-binding domain-containing protein 6 [Holothuria leucospilota]|uniref:EF-hand calcium-binding domain-containing protein 6 n=1 Tax=Holothuria leucospilota TaxID=206669 RepID=A0A9Q1H219_HOLLE|nr:EF-hand calcium-binding domain-containing protein 6 [Holothuria leucospilota]
MAAPAVQAQRPQSVGRPPNLPVIEHPMARLGSKKHLNIIGSNQGGLVSDTSMHFDLEEGHQDDFEQGGASLPSLREKKHTRNPTWPAEQNRRSTVDVIIRRRQDPEKLYNIIRDRLSSHFNVFQQQFRANDPQGRGAISKGAFSRVLYHLIGFVAMEDVGKLLDWLGINSADGISFNQFVSAFRDSETSSQRWVYTPLTPKETPSRSKAPFLEDHLRKPVQDENLDYITASYANAFLKEKCKHSDFDLRDHLLDSCFEPGALILAPQLEQCLESLGVPIDDEEMEILWSRYDLQNTGAVDAAWFFEQIGLDKFGRYLPRVRTATPRTSRSWGIPSVFKNDVVESPLPERQTPRVPSRSARTPSPDQPRPPSTDVISSLTRKMEQTYFSMLMSCEHFDYNHNGMMSKAQLKEILREYGIPMYPFDMEQLLERCNLRRKDQYVSYKDFLHKFMIRSPQGIAHRVIMDPQHSFTNRVATPAGNLSAEDAEAKLVEMLHKDFLKLLGTFQAIDPHTLHLVTQNQFRDAINKVFNMKVTNQQFHQLLHEVGTTPEGLVPYPEFLAIFNKKRYPAPNFHNNSKLPEEIEADRHSPVVQKEAVEAAVVPIEYPPVQRQPDKVAVRADEILDRRRGVMEGRFRAVHQIANIVEEKLKYNRLEAKEAFEKLDAKKTGRISRTQLHYWLQELGLVLHPTELQNLWRALRTGRDGLVHQGELLEFFTRAERRKPLLGWLLNVNVLSIIPTDQQAAMKRFRNTFNDLPDYHNGLRRSKFNLPRDEPTTQRDSLGSPNLDILGKIRPQVVKHWDELKEILRDLDPDGYGTVDIQEFRNVCHYMKFPLSEEQLTKLCQQFDFNRNSQFHYLQFMQMFAPTSVPAERHHSTKYDKNVHKIVYHSSKGVVEESVGSVLQKINKQLMKEWKNLRRAFKQADQDKNGYLDVVEFKTCIRKIIKDIKEDDLFYVLSELDANMDGKISYDEFLTHFQGA